MEDLKKQKKSLRGRLTRMSKFVVSDKFMVTSEEELKERSSNLQEMFREYKDSELNMELPDKFMDEFENDYFFVKSKLDEKLKESYNTSGGMSDFAVKCHIAPIKVPTFGGDIAEWNSFYELFTSVVHNNKTLDDLRRFQILRESLVGELLNLILHFDLIAVNYQPALQRLINNYQKNKYIIYGHLKRFIEYPPVQSSSVLRQLVNMIRGVVHAINSFGIITDTWSPILLFLLLSKIDKESKHLWELQDNPTEFVDIQFFQFLEKQAHVRQDESLSEIRGPEEIHRVVATGSTGRFSPPHLRKSYKCGYRHGIRSCPAWGKVCNKCNGKNHFASCCKAGPAKEVMANEEQIGI